MMLIILIVILVIWRDLLKKLLSAILANSPTSFFDCVQCIYVVLIFPIMKHDIGPSVQVVWRIVGQEMLNGDVS